MTNDPPPGETEGISATIREYTEGPGFSAEQLRHIRTLMMLAADRIDWLEERLAIQDQEVLSFEAITPPIARTVAVDPNDVDF